ncbi:Uu.00g025950.m01.CDS01 [Anthostomella pinea]|uniref:Uu.00g025950.m01.CDS01 n=1 Tax=Anthostomella pinea TaxID=933095 RepID=A0AAI8YCJ7_9PEZI|nr:Uu.00g025950.m01.CDS01 [Anthostomella pinea]
MSSLLPRYVSPPRGRADEHDLSELSPRPDDALLDPDSSHDATYNTENSGTIKNNNTLPGGTSVHANVSAVAKGKAKAVVTIQEPAWAPKRTGDHVGDYRAGRRAYQDRQQKLSGPELWRPPFPSEPRDRTAPNAGPHMSFFESMFMTRSHSAERVPSQVDQSFKLIQRRERQLQQETQQLLDAQQYALERNLADISQEDDDDQHSLTPASSHSDTSINHIIPVRQPKKRHMSKREARVGIARCMNQLSALKNEEEAYIATALAERKAALSRLRNLSTQRASITAEMKAIEADRELPVKNQIKKMEHKHRIVCDEIEACERRLRLLKQEKTKLESRIQEAKSVRDSQFSGYQGALRECDKGITDIMKYPGIQVLEVEDLMAQDEELRTLVGTHISGFEFLSLRPERRTLSMAKDWWEGEVQVLEIRKAAVNRERAALDEGGQIWQDTIRVLDGHDNHMSFALGVIAKYAYRQRNLELREPGEILQKQYRLCKSTVEKLQDYHNYAESQGWNLLVIALAAEGGFFTGLRKHLGETLEIAGHADGVVTPRSSSPTKTDRGEDLVDIHHSAEDHKNVADEDELSRSVIRRWDGTEEPNDNNVPADILGEHTNSEHREDESSDNEVPPGLLSDERLESEDEHHNEVPAEFLSVHFPPSKAKETPFHSGEEEEEDEHHELTRESSANEVPADLMTESRRGSRREREDDAWGFTPSAT